MYALDTKEARRADNAGNQIKELGKYVGTITQAVDVNTTKGGKGIAFTFVANTGQKANLAIYTRGADGKNHPGFPILMAMMACMSLRNIEPVQGKYTKYDFDTKADVEETGKIFPELCKPIGVLLETEEYEKQNGETAKRVVLKNVFQATTELTAGEICDRKTQPEQLVKLVEALRHRPMRAAKPQAQMPTRTAPAGSGFDDMDDDIPF